MKLHDTAAINHSLGLGGPGIQARALRRPRTRTPPDAKALELATAYLSTLRQMERVLDAGRSVEPRLRFQNALRAAITVIEAAK